MDTPQEVQVWYVLPALRKRYALELKKKGLKQKQIAKLMNITEAAVSQYLKSKRANLNLPKQIDTQINNEIKKSTNNLIKNNTAFKKELQTIIKTMNKKRIVCEICKTHTGAEENCNICYE